MAKSTRTITLATAKTIYGITWAAGVYTLHDDLWCELFLANGGTESSAPPIRWTPGFGWDFSV